MAAKHAAAKYSGLILAAATLAALTAPAFTAPALAAGLSAEAITKAVDAAGADKAKLTAYCTMAKRIEEIGDDEKKAEAAGEEIDGYFKTLGADFEAAWTAGQEAADNSAEAKAFDDALNKLEEKCPK